MAALRSGSVPDPSLAARCVDCGREVADDEVFRVLRVDREGRRHAVCTACSERRHAEKKPTPLTVHSEPPAHLRDRGKRAT